MNENDMTAHETTMVKQYIFVINIGNIGNITV